MSAEQSIEVRRIHELAEMLVSSAEAVGVNVTITLKPGPGLPAAGNTVPVIEVWPMRHRSEAPNAEGKGRP